MSTEDDRAAKVAHALELLGESVTDGIFGLRNAAAELDAHGGFESEALRLRTIACLLDATGDVEDAVRFTAPTIAAIAERLNEQGICALGLDLRTSARVLVGRVERLRLATLS